MTETLVRRRQRLRALLADADHDQLDAVERVLDPPTAGRRYWTDFEENDRD